VRRSALRQNLWVLCFLGTFLGVERVDSLSFDTLPKIVPTPSHSLCCWRGHRLKLAIFNLENKTREKHKLILLGLIDEGSGSLIAGVTQTVSLKIVDFQSGF
jgi:hypothetical protein